LATDIAQLFDQYGPMVTRRCRSMLGDEQQAAEATQEVFARLVHKDLEVRHPSSLLYQMATHECLTRLRSRRRRPEDLTDDLPDQLATTPDVDERLDAAWALDWLFGREPPSTQQIATMFLVDGMTWEQIADELGMSVSGVRKRLRRLRSHLPALVALAAAALAGVLLLPDGHRTKGGLPPELRVYRQAPDGTAELLEAGDLALGGDVLQVEVVRGDAPYGWVLSVDGLGQVTIHNDGELAPGTEALPRAYALDDAPGFEHFFVVPCDEPVPRREVVDGVRWTGDGASVDVPTCGDAVDLWVRKP